MKMKKFMWIMALLAALALIITGCPGGGDPGDGGGEDDVDLSEIFSTTELDQSDSGTRLSIGEDTFSFVGTSSANGDIQAKLTVGEEPFDAAPYLGFKFEYKSNANLQIMLVIDTSGGDDKGVWITEHDWNGIALASDWSPLEVRFSRLTKAWGNGSAFDPATLYEILFQVPDGYDDYSFELRKFEWIPNPNYVPGEPPTPPEEEPDPNPAGTAADGTEEWYLALGENGLKAQNNKKILYQEGPNYVHIYFTPPAGTYTGIKIDFTLEPAQNVSWQAAYDATGTWGGVDYIDNLTAGPIETDLAGFNQSWGASGPALDKTTLKGICLAISVEDAPSTFTLTEVTFVGVSTEPPPPPPLRLHLLMMVRRLLYSMAVQAC